MGAHNSPEIQALMTEQMLAQDRRDEEFRTKQQARADQKLLEETRQRLIAENARAQNAKEWELWARNLIISELNDYTETVLAHALDQVSDAICGAIGSEIGKLRKEDQKLMARFVRGEIASALSNWQIMLASEKMRSSMGNDVIVNLKKRTG